MMTFEASLNGEDKTYVGRRDDMVKAFLEEWELKWNPEAAEPVNQ